MHTNCKHSLAWLQVGMVYDGINMWANVQASGQPWDMRWNLGARREWRPFFGDVLPLREVATLQVSTL